MKSTQLLSVVFSLVMFTGVTAGNTAFAESDDIDDILEDFCEMTDAERSDILSEYELDDYADKLAEICLIGDEDEREESLEEVIDTIELEVYGETDDDSDDTIEDFEDCVEAGYPIMESFPEQCMTDDGQVFTNTEDDDDDIDEVNDDINETDDDRDKEYDDYFTDNSKRSNVEDRLANFCEMSEDETAKFFEHHPRLAQFEDRLANYCGLSDYARDSKIKDFIRQNITDEDREKVRYYAKDHMKEKYDDLDIDSYFREKLVAWCEMTDEEKSTTAAEYGKTEDQIAKADRYCTLDESDRADFIAEHRDEFRAHMKDRMMDKVKDKPHKMDYDRLCALAESDRAAEIDDSEKLDRISEWCEMTPEEREDYKMKHKDAMKDKMKDMPHDFDRMSDVAKDRMSDVAKDKLKMKMSDKSDRLKAMIMDKRDISDERRDEIRMKYEEKHGDLDERKSELRIKFKDHMNRMEIKISDERKSDIHDRLAEMKAYKAELREKSSDMTDEEKQELREEFIEKAKDLQLAWITPRTQIAAGIDAAEVECREGFSLVMKASNGVPMCLKADTALKMIDRGLVVPAN